PLLHSFPTRRSSDLSEISIDTETSELSPMDAQLVGIGFCIEPGEAWYVPCRGELGQEKVYEMLHHFFKTTHCGFYGHNLKYDLRSEEHTSELQSREN